MEFPKLVVLLLVFSMIIHVAKSGNNGKGKGKGNSNVKLNGSSKAAVICEAGHIRCKRESTGPMECVPACDGQIDCDGGQDELPALQCELTCPSFHVKCVVDDDGNTGCVDVCAGMPRQCTDVDETSYTTSNCAYIRFYCVGHEISCSRLYTGQLCCGCKSAKYGYNGSCMP